MLTPHMDTLRILHIIPYYDPAWAYGGSTRVVSDLTRHLAARGHAVTVLTTDALDAQHRAEIGCATIEGVQVIRCHNLSNRLAWNRIFVPVGLGRTVAQLLPQVDVAHLHEIRSLLNAAALPRLLRHHTPYIVTPHGGLPAELGRTAFKRLYDALIGRRLLDRVTFLHALTDMERQQAVDLGVPPEKVVVIPNGIDPGAFDVPADVPAFKRHFDIPAGQPVVGFVGRLNAIKGLDFLLDAFAALLARKPDAVLLLVGPDDGARAALEAQVARLGIGGSVRFTGMLTNPADKAAAYRAADVYVLPSRYENLPTTVLEALLLGTLCVVSDRCGLAAQLAEANVAQVMPFGAADRLSDLLVQALDQPEAAHSRAARGRAYVIEHFSWEAVTDRWEAVYHHCVEQAKL